MSNQVGDVILILGIALGFGGFGLWLGAKILVPLYRRLGQRMLWIGLAVVVALTFFYPPWLEVERGGSNLRGYFWLWSPPLDQYGNPAAHIDYGLMLIEWLAIALVAGLLWLAFRE